MDIADTNPFKKLAEQERSQQSSNGRSKNPQIDPNLTVPPTSINGDSGSGCANTLDGFAGNSLGDLSHSSNSSDDDDDDYELPLLNTDQIRSELLHDNSSTSLPNLNNSPQSQVDLELHSEVEDANRTNLKPSNSSASTQNKHTAPRSSQINATSPINQPSVPITFEVPENSFTSPPSQQSNAIAPQIVEQSSIFVRPPVTPKRPPILPKRRSSSIKKTSSLDPGSSSTVGSYTFYGDGVSSNSITNHNTNNLPNTTLPTRLGHSPSLPGRPSSSGTPSSTQINTNMNLPPISSTPMQSPINIPISQTHSVPRITITHGNDDINRPVLPKRPQLPSKPNLASQSNTSASELLRNYSSRTSRNSIGSTNSISINNMSSINASNGDISNNSTSIYDGLGLDEDSLQSLGIDEEMLKQQKALEEQFERQHKLDQEERKKLLKLEMNIGDNNSNNNTNDNHDLLTISTNDNDDDGDGSGSINTNDSELPDDVSQLEIPTSLSRHNRLVSTDVNSDNQLTPTTSSTSGTNVDIFANGDLTEEEFISLLPPVPKYTQVAQDTEISVPNGKAINIMTINDNHPQEKPPEYTPVSEKLKHFINRPQFSQTGGDSYTYRREQQREQQRGQREQLYQSQMESHRDLQNRRRNSTNSRHRPPRELTNGRLPTRRLPPLQP